MTITYNSIDDLVEYISTNYLFPNVYHYIIRNDSDEVLSILQYKTNKPSVHDLLLIREIENVYQSRINTLDLYKGWLSNINSILQFYKNRKESSWHNLHMIQ